MLCDRFKYVCLLCHNLCTIHTIITFMFSNLANGPFKTTCKEKIQWHTISLYFNILSFVVIQLNVITALLDY